VRCLKHKKLFITTIILDVLAFIGLFILYGPFSYIRVTVITTAMHSKSHRYLARTFYSEKMINKVLSENYMKEINENTDASKITFDKITEKTKYESKYEEQIL
jgi:exopolysaccharide biosynthesis protein